MHAGKLTEVNQDYKEICEAPVAHFIGKNPHIRCESKKPILWDQSTLHWPCSISSHAPDTPHGPYDFALSTSSCALIRLSGVVVLLSIST